MGVRHGKSDLPDPFRFFLLFQNLFDARFKKVDIGHILILCQVSQQSIYGVSDATVLDFD